MANSSLFGVIKPQFQSASPRQSRDKIVTGGVTSSQGRVVSTSKLSGFVAIRSSTRPAKTPTGSTK